MGAVTPSPTPEDRAAGLTADMATALRVGIGPERLSGYDLARGGDQLRALHLHRWTPQSAGRSSRT